MEVEAKFRVSDAGLLERLAAAPRLVGYDLERPVARRDEDVFLDTPDRRLFAAGFYLRRRENVDGVRFALKEIVAAEADGVLRREEHELRAAADVPVRDWPRGPLKARVQAIVGGDELAPVLTLTQDRRTRRVGLEGRAVAELSLDSVTARVGSRHRRWYEVEAELIGDGSEEDLAALGAALRDVWGLTPERRSKFERALALTAEDAATGGGEGDENGGGERPGDAHGGGEGDAETEGPAAGDGSPSLPEARQKRPVVAPGGSMVEAAVAVMRLHFARMLAHEAGTRAGADPEELHDMRVATRRLRMALRLFADFLDPVVMRPASKGLRRTGRTLGAVRDLDVFREKTLSYVEDLPAPRRGELDLLLAAWRVEYDARRAALVAYLDSPRYRRFVEDLGALLGGPPAALASRDGRGAATVRQVLPALLYRALADVLAIGGLVDSGAPLQRFHELRIAGKALRYTLEFFEGPLGGEAAPLIATMEQLQDHLGDLQDAVVGCGIARDVLTWGSWAPPAARRPSHTDVMLAPGLCRYLVARQDEMERLTVTFPEVWSCVAGEEFGGRLAALLARL